MSLSPLEARIRNELGPQASEPAAREAIEAFAGQMSGRFAAYLPRAQMMMIMGEGPVPEFTQDESVPDAVTPVGPVVNGWCFGTGVLAAAPF